MSIPSQQPAPFVPGIVDATVGNEHDRSDESENSERELVGEADAQPDAALTGADVDVDRAEHDSDGVPVGRDDLRADVERSGGDPDTV
jgi:hypothetical protein